MDEATRGWRSERTTQLLDAALIAGIVAVGWAGMVAASSDAAAESSPFSPAMAIIAVVVALPVRWRRQRPLGMLVAMLGGVVVAGAFEPPGLHPMQIVLTAAVLCFAIGAWTDRLRIAGGLLLALIALIVLGAAGDGTNVLAAAAYGVAVIALPAVAGYATRTRRRYLEEVEQRLADAERDRDEQARRAVLDERTRIARELHDVVAHHVSLIGVQAGAARVALDQSPEQTRAALEAIDASSRAAVGEMRQLLDALAPLPGDGRASSAGDDVEGDELAPQPSLARVQDLAAHWTSAGVPVALEVSGAIDGLTPALSLCCYRIVEEALTNVARHAGVRSADVAVHVEPDVVRIHVLDPSPAPSAGSGTGPPSDDAARWTQNGGAGERMGRGLVGMRERVALFGGELVVGPTVGGGFEVRAVLPREAT